ASAPSPGTSDRSSAGPGARAVAGGAAAAGRPRGRGGELSLTQTELSSQPGDHLAAGPVLGRVLVRAAQPREEPVRPALTEERAAASGESWSRAASSWTVLAVSSVPPLARPPRVPLR